MSLKGFHFVFILASILLSAWFSMWCFREYSDTEQLTILSMGVGAVIAVAALTVYLIWFMKKLKKVGFFGWAVALLLFGSNVSQACPVCLGDPNSPLTKSANLAIWILLSVVATVLLAFGVTFIVWARRARLLAR